MAAYFCPHCKVKSTFAQKAVVSGHGENFYVWQCHDCERIVFVVEGKIVFPDVRSEASADLPDEVRENFNEALRSLNVGNPKSAVIMTRTALQAATRQHGAAGKDLKAEIGDLANRHVIPDSLRDWAHELRDGGNLVAHPEPNKKVEAQDAEELIALADSIFDYLYVIPAEIQRRRGRLSQAP